MSLQIPESLQYLKSNCGLFAVWMIFQHYYIDIDIERLKQACQYDEDDGTFSIGLAVALKRFGFDVTLHTDEDLFMHEKERPCYAEANNRDIQILNAFSYQELKNAVDTGYFVIVFYDTLDGIGNHSLIYSIDDKEICFFDSFDAMPASVFEQQRNAEGICRQAIVIDGHNFSKRYS